MSFKGALVDFDGTLADSMPFWYALPWETLRRAGEPAPEGLPELARTVPMWEVANLFSRMYPGLSPERPLGELWLAQMEENYRTRISLKPGALSLLALLREKGLKIAVASATREPMLGNALGHFGLEAHIDAVLTEAEYGSKRERGLYAAFAGKLGCSLSELLLVEDAARNLAAARSFGLGTVGVYDETMEADLPLLRENADVYLKDYSDLTALAAFLG